MKYKKFIFDIGANNGVDGLAMAIKNKTFFVHAFEPNMELYLKINKLKKKLEKRKGIKIKNYKIHNLALSDKKKNTIFNISVNDTVSSLNKISKNLDKYWPGYREAVFKIKKKIKIKTITLFDFMKERKIEHINYLHIDTQGHDLKILNGLKNKINKVFSGKLEASLNKKKAAYEENHTIADIKKKFKKTHLKISKIENVHHFSSKGKLTNEVNIFFENKNIILDKLDLKYNTRYHTRVLNGNTSLKDDLIDMYSRVSNFFLNI